MCRVSSEAGTLRESLSHCQSLGEREFGSVLEYE